MCSWMAGYLANGGLTARQAKYIISHISLSKNIPLTWAMWARPLSICTLIHNVHCFQLQSSIISDMGLLSKWLFWGAFYAFIWQASSRGDRKGERGDDMQPLAESESWGWNQTPGCCQGLSLFCTWGACSTKWAKGRPDMGVISKIHSFLQCWIRTTFCVSWF